MSKIQIITIHDEQDPVLTQLEEYRRQRNEELLKEKLIDLEPLQGGEGHRE